MDRVKSDGGLHTWIGSRDVDLSKGDDVVLWHAFGVTHVPRVEGQLLNGITMICTDVCA
jgi:Cu2+-containing amine oxidase